MDCFKEVLSKLLSVAAIWEINERILPLREFSEENIDICKNDHIYDLLIKNDHMRSD